MTTIQAQWESKTPATADTTTKPQKNNKKL